MKTKDVLKALERKNKNPFEVMDWIVKDFEKSCDKFIEKGVKK